MFDYFGQFSFLVVIIMGMVIKMIYNDLDKMVVRFLKGEDDAFDYIYDETKKTVYLSIYQIFKSKDKIEDIMQDTYLKAIENMHKYEIGTNFKAWIAKIARNLAINDYNKNKIIEHVDDFDDFENDKKNSDISLVDRAYEILDANPVKYEKEVFTYRIVIGLGYREIGEILDIPKSTVFDIYNRCIKKIPTFASF